MTGAVSANGTRREFLVHASLFGWIPFLRPRRIGLAGARFRILRHGRSRRRYLVIHGNEETARQVLLEHIRAHPGIAFVIETHTRNIPVEGGEVDPNRMFSRAGAEASLRSLNPGWTAPQIARALRVLDAGRERLVRAFFPPDRGLLIALHNNSTQYSVTEEVPQSNAVSLNEADNPHAFFLATDAGDFRKLSASPYNAVLQDHPSGPDDGSLSRLAARRNVRYVNLEVAIGQLERQRVMLEWADRNLP